jgi:hypothetical protein
MKINEIIKENLKVTGNTPQGITLTGPDGTTITLSPEKLAALQANPTDPNKFSINPEVLATTDTTQTQNTQNPIGPKVGSDVEFATTDIQTTETLGDEDLMVSKDGKTQNKPIGGDATDRFISQVSDREFERNARHGRISESEDLIAMLTIAGLR